MAWHVRKNGHQQQVHHLFSMWGLFLSVWALVASCCCHGVFAQVDSKEFPDLSGNKTLKHPWRLHTLFSVECHVYFDWQTVGMMHSFRKSGQPGPITRLLSCTEEQLEEYQGLDLAPSHMVPSMSKHPVTGDWYTISLCLSLSNLCYSLTPRARPRMSLKVLTNFPWMTKIRSPRFVSICIGSW